MAHRQYGVALFMAGKYGDSLPHMQRSIELNGRDLSGYRRLAELDERMGNLLNALAALDRPEFRPSADLGRMYALLGRRAEALTMVKSLTTRGSDPYRIGALYVALGDRDRGFEWLTRAFDERQPVVSFVKFDPKFDAVRSDPRFRDLVARLKLP